MLAKGSLIGSCFLTLFKDDLFFELARYANKAAQKMAKIISDKGYTLNPATTTNLIFPVLPNTKIKELAKYYKFHIWEKADDENSVIRLVCSWATDENEIDKFTAML